MYWLNNQDTFITKKISLLISLNSDSLSSYLTPILAQYNIKYVDFLTLFIKEYSIYSSHIFPDLFLKNLIINSDLKHISYYPFKVRVYVFLQNNGKYILFFEKPTISFMILYFLRKKYKKLRQWKRKSIFFQLFKLAYMICFVFEKIVLKTQLRITYKNLLNYLHRSGGDRWRALNFERFKKRTIL